MDETEFKGQIIKEMKASENLDSQFAKVEQAFNDRRTREAGKPKKSNLTRNLSIFVSSVAAVVLFIVLSVVFWPKGKDNGLIIYFDRTTPYQTVHTIQEIKNHIGVDIKLPLEFDEGFTVQEIKIYYPTENNPCAVEMNYRKLSLDDMVARVNIMVVLAGEVSYYEDAKYDDCNQKDTVNETDYYYLLRGSGYSTTIMAKFELNQIRYYYESYIADKIVLNSFILSLE